MKNIMKTMSGLLILGAMPFVLVACATGGEKSASGPAIGKGVENNEALAAKAKDYKQSVHGVTEAELKPGGCAHHYLAVRSIWSWKEAVAGANACMKSKEYDHVEELGNMLAVREPGAAWGPYYLALVAKQNGQLERAQWMTELALKRGSDLAVVYHLKGQILWTKKDFKGAVANFEKSLELDSQNIPAHLFLGQVYFRDQDFSKASKHFYAVLKYESRQPVALAGLAESQLRENNPQGALDAYSRLAQANPRDGQYLSRIGEIYETVLNDIPQALSVYRQLQSGARSGQITKNIDPQNDSKVRELESAVQKTRALASTTEDKARGRK